MFTFASLFTLGLLVGFVFVIILLIGYYGGGIDMTMVVGLTVIFNIISWLISPFMLDLMLRWFYKSKKWTIDDIRKRNPQVATFIEGLVQKHGIKMPMFRYIEDDNPTAFTYGSGIYNARIAFSEGLFHYLDHDETSAVIAHEFGHIIRRDFIIMTIAQTMVQVLYELAHLLLRSGKGDRDKGKLYPVGLLAYGLYFVSMYLLLFLSRTREYGADKFAADNTPNPDSLSRALIKIAYGIIAKPDSQSQNHLLNSTRALGVSDHRTAKGIGTAFESAHKDWQFIGKVLLFDLVSPWAKILELSSTHPLTGKRIDALGKMAMKRGKRPSINVDEAKQIPYDKQKLYNGFFLGAIIHFLPQLSIFAILIWGTIVQTEVPFLLLIPAFGLAIIVKTLYKYPNTKYVPTTTLEAMTDLYANPVRGKQIALQGKIVGRGMAGSHFTEDVMLQDKTGLIYLNYESAFSFLGNLFFALGRVKKLIGREVKVRGWFFRGVIHHMDLHDLQSHDDSFTSRPAMWQLIFGAGIMIVGFFIAFGG